MRDSSDAENRGAHSGIPSAVSHNPSARISVAKSTAPMHRSAALFHASVQCSLLLESFPLGRHDVELVSDFEPTATNKLSAVSRRSILTFCLRRHRQRGRERCRSRIPLLVRLATSLTCRGCETRIGYRSLTTAEKAFDSGRTQKPVETLDLEIASET